LTDLIADLRNGAGSANAGDASSSPPTMAKKKADLRPVAEADPSKATAATPPGINQPHFSAGQARSTHAAGAIELHTENVRQIWDEAVAKVEDMTADHAKLAGEIAIRAPNQLAAIFSTKYNFSKIFCERPDRAAKLEDALETVIGRRIRIQFELAEEPANGGDIGPKRTASPRQRRAELEADVRRRPIVERAVELFAANVEILEKPACSKELEI
ncbi:MAG TPA: hypothetical protein VGY55_03845, partial [Pirellulales bacterium]|nr:hypothetical protein [Pirellulales bacterium]